MKFGQILVYYITNISNMVLSQSWTLETTSGPFDDFIEMKIKQDLAIFNSWHLTFLIALFKKNEELESWPLFVIE